MKQRVDTREFSQNDANKSDRDEAKGKFRKTSRDQKYTEKPKLSDYWKARLKVLGRTGDEDRETHRLNTLKREG